MNGYPLFICIVGSRRSASDFFPVLSEFPKKGADITVDPFKCKSCMSFSD
jgi:hypothetical protein